MSKYAWLHGNLLGKRAPFTFLSWVRVQLEKIRVKKNPRLKMLISVTLGIFNGTHDPMEGKGSRGEPLNVKKAGLRGP